MGLLAYEWFFLVVGELCLYVVDNVCVRHKLIAKFGIMQLLPYRRIVEDEHSTLGGNVKFLRQLHDDARYLAI